MSAQTENFIALKTLGTPRLCLGGSGQNVIFEVLLEVNKKEIA